VGPNWGTEGFSHVKNPLRLAYALNLLLSIQYQRVVRGDSTVSFGNLSLQLPKTRERWHYARCPVLVHEFLDGTLGVSYQNRLIA
jgi:hypothetical protein